MCVARRRLVRWMRRVSRARARARAPGRASGGLGAFSKQCSAANALPMDLPCAKAMQNSEPSTLEVSQLSCSAVLSLAPSFLVCYWTLVGRRGAALFWGPSRPNRWQNCCSQRIAAFARSAPRLTRPVAEGSASPHLTARPPRSVRRVTPPLRRNHGLRRRRHQGQV